jgi:ABC-type transport system substrate-binding protein
MSGRIVLVAGLVAAMTVAASMGGCAHRPPSANLDEESGAAPLTACWPFTGRPVPADPIIFALGDSVNPLHAPVPHNLSERMVFRNLYETLVQVDCDGDVIPSLATAWYSYDEDRRWVFYLRRSTRFWDGTPLRADHVAASWQATRRHSDKRPGDPLVWLDASTVQTIGPDRLVIELPE